MAKLDFPSSPTPGQIYAAPNGVTYTWDDTIGTIGAWTAVQTDPLAITSPGSISGSSPKVGETLVYATGQATGGVFPYTYNWEWRLFSDDTTLQVGGNVLTIPLSALGDQIYIYFTVTDAASSSKSANTALYPFDGVITQQPFPNLVFDPAGSPNASPDFVDFGNLSGTATATWPSTPSPTNLTVTGDIQISVDGGTYGTTGTIYSTQIIKVRWNPNSIAAAADNATLTGSFTDGTYENDFSITVDRSPNTPSIRFSDLTSEPKNAQITSDSNTPSGYNVPITLSITGSSIPLTSIGASVDGGAFTSSNQTVIPGQSVQLRGTTGSTNTTSYGITASFGSGPTANDTWTVTTTDVAVSIAQPSITAPENEATDVNPAAQYPAEVTITSSTYTPENGAGTHASSDWELYENGYPLTSTNTITGVIDGPNSPLTPVTDLVGKVMGLTYDSSRSRFYAAGAAGEAWISTDGLTWSSTPSNSTRSFYRVASNPGGTLVAISRESNNLIFYSLDGGETWTPGSFNTNPNDRLINLLWAGSRFVTSAHNCSNVWVSADGITFTKSATRPFGCGAVNDKNESLAWDPNTNRLIATRGTGNRNPRLAWTTDFGATWTTSSNLNSYYDAITSVAGGYLFFAAYTNTQASYSTNGGTTVTDITSQFSTKPRIFWEENGTYYAALSDNSILASADPTNWTGATTVAGASLDMQRRFEIAQSPTGVAISTFDEFVNVGTGFSSSATLNTLTIAGAEIDGFREGDTVVSNPAGGGPATIVSLDNTKVVVTSSTGWLGNSSQNLIRDPNSYSLINSSTGDTANLVSWPVAQSYFTASTSYYTRVRYTSTDPVSSSWSAWSEFNTASQLLTPPGTALAGGYYGGQINDNGTIYNLIVAPITEGSLEGQLGGYSPSVIQYKTSASGDGVTAQNLVWGAPATIALADANHPMFNWVVNSATGPNAGAYDASNTTGTGIGGYNDWYIPATYELNVLYFFLKPNSQTNTTRSGSNPNSVAPYTPNTAYGPGFPSVTTSPLFLDGGIQAFMTTVEAYWTSTQNSSNTGLAMDQKFFNAQYKAGFLNTSYAKNKTSFARAIRRVPA